MILIDERTGLEVLARDDALRLLGSQHLGRLAVSIGTRPMIFPVNFVMDGDDVVFRTDVGTKLSEAIKGAFVAFEVDQVDSFYRSGWSVVVAGQAEEITDPHELARARSLPLRPWAKGDKSHWVRVRPMSVTGRRITHVADS